MMGLEFVMGNMIKELQCIRMWLSENTLKTGFINSYEERWMVWWHTMLGFFDVFSR